MAVIDDWRPLADSLAAATERLATTVSSSGLATPVVADDDDAVSPGSQFSSRSTLGAEATVGVDVEGTCATRAVEGAEAEEDEEVTIVDSSCPSRRFRITRAASIVASREMAADRRAALPLREASAKLVYRSSSG